MDNTTRCSPCPHKNSVITVCDQSRDRVLGIKNIIRLGLKDNQIATYFCHFKDISKGQLCETTLGSF